jgi:hypothetical protein
MAFLHPIAVLILWTVVRPEKPPQAASNTAQEKQRYKKSEI